MKKIFKKKSQASKLFNEWINYLAKYYKLVTLDELLKYHIQGKSISGLLAITLDDGWSDTCTPIARLCEQNKIPITIYVPLMVGVELEFVIVTKSSVVSPCAALVVTTVSATAVLELIVKLGPSVVTTVGLATVLPVIRRFVAPEVVELISALYL